MPPILARFPSVDVQAGDVDAEPHGVAAGLLGVLEVAADATVGVLERIEREGLADDLDAEDVRQRDRPVDAAGRRLDNWVPGLRRGCDRDREQTGDSGERKDV